MSVAADLFFLVIPTLVCWGFVIFFIGLGIPVAVTHDHDGDHDHDAEESEASAACWTNCLQTGQLQCLTEKFSHAEPRHARGSCFSRSRILISHSQTRKL